MIKSKVLFLMICTVQSPFSIISDNLVLNSIFNKSRRLSCIHFNPIEAKRRTWRSSTLHINSIASPVDNYGCPRKRIESKRCIPTTVNPPMCMLYTACLNLKFQYICPKQHAHSVASLYIYNGIINPRLEPPLSRSLYGINLCVLWFCVLK
jgi:hypothetical protein